MLNTERIDQILSKINKYNELPISRLEPIRFSLVKSLRKKPTVYLKKYEPHKYKELTSIQNIFKNKKRPRPKSNIVKKHSNDSRIKRVKLMTDEEEKLNDLLKYLQISSKDYEKEQKQEPEQEQEKDLEYLLKKLKLL